MKNYAGMSSRGFQSTTNIRLHYVLGARLRRTEGRLVEEVNQMLKDGLGLDGTEGKHRPSDRTAREWVRRFSDLPEKTYRSPSDAQEAILPEFLPYWGTNEFHARQDHRLDVMSQGVYGFPVSQQKQSCDSPGGSLLKFLGAVCAELVVVGGLAVAGELMNETPRKAGGSNYPRRLSLLRTQWQNIHMRDADQARTPPERDNSGIMAHARSLRQGTTGEALTRLRAASKLDSRSYKR